ncbi:MAG TPA: nuclear transport factor 2 family protein [Polyangiaceae bacterium]|jgi:predicted SnoaL-like aldol condensation-catalyzing enzyme|nr:nuclear transport factor 2 family protein [Polyangiaceae bacterium]
MPASAEEENKRLAKHWLDAISEHRVEEICALTAPAWQMHGGPPALPPGPAGVRTLFAAFGPVTQRWAIDLILAEGELVAMRATNRCEQESFFGIPAAGRQQTFTATFIHRIAGGLIQETWRNADDLGRVLQLGARIEPPAT